jgi:hypothetical protein
VASASRPGLARGSVPRPDNLPELAKSKNVSFLDIDSGHWPMISAPTELARLLAQAAEQS